MTTNRSAILLAAALVISAAVPMSVAQENKPAPLLSTEIGGKDLLMLRALAHQGLAQLQLAEMAKTQAARAEVKSLASSLIEDYEAIDEALRQLAVKKGVECPTDPGAEEQTTIEKLGKATGSAFDKAYIDEVIRIHGKQISALEGALESKDTEIKAFATEELPVLREHLTLAQKFSGSVSVRE